MKNKRQAVLADLIRTHRIDTQGELLHLLIEQGFPVTQATVSRDIRELNIVKSADDDGIYRYHIQEPQGEENVPETFRAIFRQAVRTAEAANNMVVVKTYSGMGNAVGAAVDSMKLPNCVGTLAGDDTLLIIAKSKPAANEICINLKQLLKKDGI